MPKRRSDLLKPASLIRPFRAVDRAELLRLRLALWPDCSSAMHRYEMRAYSTRSRNRAVLVIDRGREAGLGGFIELTIRARVDGSMSDRLGYVEGWYVDRALRGLGWGRKMIRAAEAWTSARGLTELGSDAELANQAGVAAHRACGFLETFRVVQFLKKVRR